VPVIFEDIDPIGKDFLANFLAATVHGNCYHFALALYRNLDWSIVGVVKDSAIQHAGVKSPDGKFWDGRGAISRKEFASLVAPPWVIRAVGEEELVSAFPVSERMVETISERAQMVWPHLPWKKGTLRDRIAAFASDLEALSRKHKFWICGTTPMSLPVIFQGYDDEAGYAVRPSVDGNAHIINRVIGRIKPTGKPGRRQTTLSAAFLFLFSGRLEPVFLVV